MNLTRKTQEILIIHIYDIAGFPRKKGYQLLVSERQPIVSDSAARHSQKIKSYPCELTHVNTCGKLIAFHEEIDWENLHGSMIRVLNQSCQTMSHKLTEELEQLCGAPQNDQVSWLLGQVENDICPNIDSILRNCTTLK